MPIWQVADYRYESAEHYADVINERRPGQVYGSREQAWRFMNSLRIARVGSSFGGVRSDVSHPASTSHRQLSSRGSCRRRNHRGSR